MSDVLTRIDTAVNARREEILALLQQWVQIPTQTPPGENYIEIVGRILPRFAALGFDARRVDMPPDVFEQRSRVHYPELVGPRANLLARLNVPGKPPALWYTHLDTVPIGDASKWSVPPFEGVVKDGKVWGRGTVDSKAGAVALVVAFETLRDLGMDLAVSPVIALTTDEEVGPYTGLMYLADQGEFRGCQWFHSCDAFAGSVGIATAGGFNWSIRVAGKSVHSGRSLLGINPIEHSLPLFDEILALKQVVQTRLSWVPQHPEVVNQGGGSHLRALLNITIAHGGFKYNVVPPEFVIEGDRRFLPEEDEESAIAELRGAVDRACARDRQLDAKLTIRPFYTSYAIATDHIWPRKLQRVAEAITGETHPLVGSNGSSDVAHVARVTGIPTARLGVGRPQGSNAHGIDENVQISDIINLIKIICALATDAVP